MKNTILKKAVLVTGASSGIGRAIAIEFDRAGAHVAIASRRIENLKETALMMNSPLVIQTDMSDPGQARSMIDKTAAHFGRIDILINNAASIIVSRADELTPEEINESIAVNLTGPLIAIQRAVYYMRKQGHGHIINVGSPGFMLGIPLYGAYAASKAAFSGLTRTMQAEWNGECVYVSEYYPGYIKTDSPANSRSGPVAQDSLIDPDQNPVMKFFTRPKTPGDAAKQIVKLAENPSPLVWSGFTVKLGAFLSLLPGMRISMSSALARVIRKKLNLDVFGNSL
jgi:NAD(P)-dependent dehydrogenase (short-subunit alcohol dehydrogenase family)